uniref:Glutathione S-transferase 1, isoform D n=1 Tax=Aceria tosichella TaxID=561515 RepID=A0A6G1SNS2_9ACAR
MSPPVQFYYMPESAACRAVELVAGMVGVKLDKHHVNLMAGDHLKEDYVKLYPLHKVPFIVDGGLKMGESRAIMMYLVNKYKPNDPLYPNDADKRAAIDELLFYEIGTLYQAHLLTLIRPFIVGNAKVIDPEQEKALKESLQYVDQRIGAAGTKFMFGNQLTIADISLMGTLDYTYVTDYDLSEYKNLVAYLARVKAAIPNYSEINDKPLEDFRQWIRSKRAAN